MKTDKTKPESRRAHTRIEVVNPDIGTPKDPPLILLQVHFENPPVFVTLPYSSVGLGGRRWRLWQSQLSSIGKVYPVIMPEALSEPGRAKGLVEFSEIMMTLSLARVKEVCIHSHSHVG